MRAESEGNSHIDRAFFFEYIVGLLSLIIERDIDTDALQELDLVFRSSRGDDFQTRSLSKLYDHRTDGP